MKTGQVSLTSSKGQLVHAALERRLLLYAFAAGATLVCSAPTQAEVLFTPSSAFLRGVGKLDIDIDHDGSADFSLTIKMIHYSTHSLELALLAYGNHPSHQIVAQGASALALEKKTRIGGGRTFRAFTAMETAVYGGPWADVTNRFLGVRFLINGEVHYGWIGFREVRNFPMGARLAGWAYEAVPDKAILAGDTGTGASADSFISPTSLEILAAGHTAIDERRKRSAHDCDHRFHEASRGRNYIR
jgi:hypothetical protein